MLPMSLASEEAKQMQQQARREMAITMSSLPSSGGGGGQSAAGNSVLAIGPRKEDVRFVPLSSMAGSKSCNITFSNIQPGTTTGVPHQIQGTLKSKLTAVNVVPKTLNSGTVTSGTTTGSAPLFQLVPSPNNPNQPLVAILAPPRKTMGGAGAVPSNAKPVVIRSGPALNKAQLTIQNGIATMTTTPAPAPAPAPAAAAAGTSGPAPSRSLLVKSELPQKAAPVAAVQIPAAGGAGQISLLANPLKPRAPLILSKVAVDKLQLKFNQFKANPKSIILGKSSQVKRVLPVPGGSNISSIRNSSVDEKDSKKPVIPIKPPVPLVAEEVPKTMPTNNNNNNNNYTSNGKSLIKPKPSSIKAVPLPASQDIITPKTPPKVKEPEAKIKEPEAKIKEPEAKTPPKQPNQPAEAANLHLLKEQKAEFKEFAQEHPKPQQPETLENSKPRQPEARELPKLQQLEAKDLPKSPKLQRSKSFVAVAGQTPPVASSSERRHSVAIMAKEVDVIEEPSAPIETITIEDDDEDSEEEIIQKEIILPILPAGITISTTTKSGARSQLVKKNFSVTTISSSKKTSSSASSTSNSDVEEIPAPVKNIEKEISLLPGISIIKAETLPLSKEDFERSLRCDEQVPNTPPSSGASSVASDTASPTKPAAERTVSSSHRQHRPPGSRANVLKKSMVQNLPMLRWRGQQPAKLQNSSMCFELNRFNLLQLNERCELRQGPASYFERALLDRPSRRPTGSIHPLLYLCQRCNCHGPAADFLAPHYCSLCCVRRAQKRRLPPNSSQPETKMSRAKMEPQANNNNKHQQSKPLADIELHRPKDNDKLRKPFRWSEYLKAKGRDVAAPIHLFVNPFPISPNCFERGMKLEAIDPENCSLFCVCSIAEVRGYRLKLTFDGYSSMYDFWVNADSQDIFPPGWCDETGRLLQAPRDYCPERFSWSRYLVKTNSKAAPRALFAHLTMPHQTGVSNGFAVGMHLEAEDLNDTGKICVATVADILDERVRVHFDGWDDCYDLWVHVSSPYIHPCGWHENRQQLIVPPDFKTTVFSWPDYIADVGGVAAPKHLFQPRQPMEYQARMKLEVVDQRNPCLIRPATIVTRKGYRVQIHLDCWPSEYYFWLEDDSPDLHPIGWCEATSHDLETPPGYLQATPLMPCDVDGCRGFGNAKRFNLNVHALRDCCPYAPENWRQWRSKTVKPARVSPDKIRRGVPTKQSRKKVTSEDRQLPFEEGVPPKVAKKRPTPPPCAEERKVKKHKAMVAVDVKKEEQKLDPCARTLNIAKSFLKDYGPQFLQNYRLWRQNSTLNQEQIRTNPLHWTTWDVYEFMERAMDSADIARVIFEHEIDGRALLMLGRQELDKYLNLKVGPAAKLYSLIMNLRIAVVCKFETNSTGLGINFSELEHLKEDKVEDEPESSKVQGRSNGWSKMEHNQELFESEEDDEDDDVVLDSEDFLSVKPSGRLVIDEDTDVGMMQQLDVCRPMTTAS
ncbi:hypothetical protein KR054_009419 [Drosophila jambulina]|nr:hypothetical protein KR054_009419 [Drosophila jambulina]